jgi:zinc protease
MSEIRRMRILVLFLTIQFLFSESNSFGQDSLPVDPAIRMGTLANGFRYYIRYNSKPINKAALRLAIRVGSIVEDEDQLGLAHFVEHMCFNGTENFSKNELIKYLESVGTRFGPDLNAFTSFDETVYMLEVRTDDSVQLDKGLLILEDWMARVLFDHEEIDKERGVVTAEWRNRLSAEERMQSKYFPVMYKGSRYAERLPIGKPEIIQDADYEVIKRFYNDWYRPELMALVIVGDIDVDKLEKEVQDRFSAMKNKTLPRPREAFSIPRDGSNDVVICSDSEAGLSTVRVMYKHPGNKILTQDDFRSLIVQNLYNTMMNQRLRELQLQEDPPFIFAYSGYGNSVGDLATFTAYAAVQESKIIRGLRTLLEETSRVRQHGFTLTEFERAKQVTLTNVEKAFLEQDKTESASLAMAYVYHFLDQNPIPSAEQRLDLYKKYLPDITLEEINQLTEKWITDTDRLVVITAPEKEGFTLPEEAEIILLMEEVSTKKLKPFEDDVLDAPLISSVPEPASIVEMGVHEDAEFSQWILENGVKVVIKQTDFKNDEILFYAVSPGGMVLLSEDDLASARFSTGVVSNSGLGGFSAIQLEKRISGKKARVSAFIGETSEGMNGFSSPDDLEILLQLVYLHFTAPGFEESAIRSIIDREKGFLENLDANPNAYFSREITRFKFNEHVRRRPLEIEDLEKVSGEASFRLFRERFANASDFTFFLIGNVDPIKHQDLITRYLGRLPVTDKREALIDPDIRIREGRHELIFNKGKAQKSLVEITLHGAFDFQKEDEHLFQSLLEIARIKLRESLREEMGGVYGVGVYGSPSRISNNFSITISFSADPGQAQDLTNAVWLVLNKLKDEGPEEEDIVKIKETQRQTRKVDLENNRFWLSILSYDYLYNLDPGRHLMPVYEKKIDALTKDRLKQAANKYFSGEHMIKAILYPSDFSPFEKIKP